MHQMQKQLRTHQCRKNIRIHDKASRSYCIWLIWNRSAVTNKKRKNILISTVAEKGVMTLMVQIYCNGCMRWIQIPFYSPKKLLHAEKLRESAEV